MLQKRERKNEKKVYIKVFQQHKIKNVQTQWKVKIVNINTFKFFMI